MIRTLGEHHKRCNEETIMKRVIVMAVLVGLLVWCGSAVVQAGELGKQILEATPLKLLDGRVLVKMPMGAKKEALGPASIMASAPSTQRTDRAVFKVDKEKLVLVASETFGTVGEDAEKEVRRYYAKAWFGEFTLTPLKFDDAAAAQKLMGFLLYPTRPPADEESRVVVVAAIVLPDKTVVAIDVYVNPTAYDDKDGCRKVAEAILASIRPGEKKLALEGGVRRLGLSRKKKDLAVELPANFAMTIDRGPDFDVYRFIPVLPLNKESGNLSIYFGMQPEYQYKQRASEESDKEPAVRKVDGKILGRDVKWHVWTAGTGTEARKFWEVMLDKILPEDDHTIAHVFLNAATDEAVAALRKVAESLKVVDVQEEPAPKPKDAPSGAVKKP